MDETIGRLRAEGDRLDELVAHLEPETWRRATPAVGWSIAHQIGHLQWTDEVALVAVTRPEDFQDVLRHAVAAATLVDDEAAARADLPAAELLARWRRGRTELADALASAPEGTKLPWFGPPMSPRSMATARLMETWAHGQDVADALGVHREPTEALRDIAHLGVRTRDFAHRINNLQPPADEFRVELDAPDGSSWTWGPEDAAQRVTGSAEEFCLVVTQRRDVDRTGLVVTGADATRWLQIAQAFAGPPGRASTPTPRSPSSATTSEGRART